MIASKKTIASIMPWRIRRAAHVLHDKYEEQRRKYVFKRTMKKFVQDPLAEISNDSSVLTRLVYGWGNEEWSALEDYLLACSQHALRATGPILECGTGLSTIMLGAIAQKTGNVVWSLEHTTEWAERITQVLGRYRITSVRLCVNPLKDYGEFSWYDPPLSSMPESFSIVVCDGPPGQTKGGRYGLLPVMGRRLKAGACILLDDAAREDEKTIAARWATELKTDYRLIGSQKPYILITIPT